MTQQEAIKRIKTWNLESDDMEVLSVLIPELKESEDERIRKGIVKYLEQSQFGEEHYCVDDDIVRYYIAWLEKQGEQKQDVNYLKFNFDDVLALQCCMGIVKKIQEDKELYEQLQSLHDRIHDAYWFEKQGEQKPIDKIQINKKYKCIASPRYTMFMIGKIYEPKDKFLCSLMNFCSDCFEPIEDGENNYTDKVEPKFKVGDWIISDKAHEDYHICKIIESENGNYKIESIYGCKGYNQYKVFDSIYRLWTIKDAKPGDVLVTDTWLYIFKYTNNKGLIQFYCNCPIKGKPYKWNFIPSDSYLDIYTDANIHPATKEQRDLLFSKMKDAGYEWDAEKKELKKIEQKPIDLPNGEDYGVDGMYAAVDILTKTLGKVEGYQTDDGILEHKAAIAAVKKLREQKSTKWSVEDEMQLDSAIHLVDSTGHIATTNWLKSLKEKYTWKPNDDQMEALLYEVNAWDEDSVNGQNLKSLYQDLKKLKGE